MSIQGYQNAYHNHGYTPSGSVSSSFSGSRGKTDSDGSHTHDVNVRSETLFLAKGNVGLQGSTVTGMFVDFSNVYVSGGTSTDGSHKHSYTPSGSVSSSFSGNTGTTTYDGNSSNHEARPSNYTYVIWKRVS